jgi:Tfp pilus assembly protein PilN
VSQQVNLYSPLFRRQEKKFSARAMAQAGAVIAAGIVLLAGLNFWQLVVLRAELKQTESQRRTAMKQLEEASRQYKPRVGDARLAEDVAKLEAILNASSQAQGVLRRDVFGDNRGYSGYFIALARQSLPELYLTGVDIVGAGQSIEITGRAPAKERVTQYLARLSSEKALSGAEFKVFRLEHPEFTPPAPARAQPAARKPERAAHAEFVLRTAERTAKVGKP